MRTTVEVDADLLAKAREMTGEQDDANLVRRALAALIERTASRRLALLGGSDPTASAPPRRRFEAG